MKKLKEMLKNLRFMLGKVWEQKSGKMYIVIRLILTIISPIVALSSPIFSGLLIDEITQQCRINMIAIYIFGLTAIPTVWGVISHIVTYFCTSKMEYMLKRAFEGEFYEHISQLDYDFYDQPQLQDMRTEASEVVMNDFIGSVNSLCTLISAIVNLIAISALITSLNWIIGVVILLNVIFNYFINKKHKNKLISLDTESHKRWRYHWLYSYILDSELAAKEVRLFQLDKFIVKKIVTASENLDKINREKDLSSHVTSGIQSLTAFIQNVVLYCCAIGAVLAQVITVGYMTISVSAANQLFNTLNSFSQMYLNLYRTSTKVTKYIDFMKISRYQCQTGDMEPQWDLNSEIEFKNVSFCYPGSDRMVIDNLNIIIKSGEKLAIVGENGSGKSTFIKLLTRLYAPTKGEIFLNGVNIYEYDYTKYQKLFSPVFQDYHLYDMTIEENIALSETADENLVRQTCISAGLGVFLDKLPNNLKTQLGKNIDPEGVKLSGGEGQRLAIARSRYHNRSIYILDEPTAALDPNAEYEIYTQFNDMIKNKTAVLVTHRLSAVQLADKVAVFDGGQVVEYGTHAELYAKGGIYTEMFDKQAQFYRNNSVMSPEVTESN